MKTKKVYIPFPVINKIKSLLSSKKEIEDVKVFGSRVLDKKDDHSDIDLCLFGDLPWDYSEKIKYDLEELPLIYTFDVLSYQNISNKNLRKHIDKYGISIFKN